jgi:hypothetical protein
MEKRWLVLGAQPRRRQRQAEDNEFPHHKLITLLAARKFFAGFLRIFAIAIGDLETFDDEREHSPT